MLTNYSYPISDYFFLMNVNTSSALQKTKTASYIIHFNYLLSYFLNNCVNTIFTYFKHFRTNNASNSNKKKKTKVQNLAINTISAHRADKEPSKLLKEMKAELATLENAKSI